MNPIRPSDDDAAWRQVLEYLDGSLSADEVRALNERCRTDAGLRAAFADVLAQEIKLKELGEEAALAAEDAAAELEPIANIVHLPPGTAEELPEPAVAPAGPTPLHSAPGTWKIPLRSVLALAASVVAVGLAVWLWGQPTQLAQLNSVDGELTIERKGRTFAATPGIALRVGDQLHTGANSRARFRYLSEETEVALEGETRLELELEKGSKRLQLDQGTLEAVVAKQKPETPLRLGTRQADAVVVGTRFKLLASDATTRLEVFEGAVSVRQGPENLPLLVAAGKGVTVVPGQPVVLENLAESRGTILLEHWDGTASFTNQTYLSQFMFSGVGVKPGNSRARGYLHPPRSGAYSFAIAGTGNTELWLSTSDDPALARKVWASGESAAVPVVAQLRTDQRYYLELRCTSDSEPAAFTVSWTTPGGQQRVIYGDYLSPFDPGAAATR